MSNHKLSEGHVLFEYFTAWSSGQHYAQNLCQGAVHNQIPHEIKMLNSTDCWAVNAKVKHLEVIKN